MADILSLEEKEALLWAHGKPEQLKKLFDRKDDEVDVDAVLEILETGPSFATKVMDKCRSPEHGFEGSLVKEAVKFLGVGVFRQIVLESIEEESGKKSATNPSGRIVTGYDFKHPARVNKDQLRTLENLHDNFARLLSSTFSGAMRAVVDVDTAFVDQTTYAEFIMSLSNPAMSYQFTLGPTKGQAIIDIAMPLVCSFVDRIFGGKGSSKGVDPRQMTPIEIGVINRIIRRVIEDLEATWEPILPVEVTEIELETNPEFMQITAANEIVILLAFEVNSTNASGLVSLCYPFFTLESILPRLGQQTFVRRSEESKEELRLNNRLRLGSMDLPMVAELGRTKIELEAAESLQPGDIVRLPARATDPATVYLGDRPKFLVRPFAEENGEIKLKVVGKAPRE